MNTTHKLVHTINTPLWEIHIYNFPECLFPWNTRCKSILHDKEEWYTHKTEKEALDALSEMSQTKGKHIYTKGDKISEKRFPQMAPYFNKRKLTFTNLQVAQWYVNRITAGETVKERRDLCKELYRYLFLDNRGHTLLNYSKIAHQICLRYYVFLGEGHFTESNITPLIETLSNRLLTTENFRTTEE